MSYPNGKHGICGDPYVAPQPRKHEANGQYWSGKSQMTYTEGQVADLNVVLTAYHKGYFEFRICKIEGTAASDEASQLNEGCLDKHVLKQAAGAQSPGEARYYIGPTQTTSSYTLPYQLPKGLVCDGNDSRCVMQWHWVTGNSCNPPGTPSQYGTAGLQECGPGSPYPEEFWNCANITIMPSSEPVPVPEPVKPSPSPSPSPEPVPEPVKPSPSPSPTEPITDAAKFCQGKTYGFHADTANDCRSYYRCESTGSWRFDCPASLQFNQAVSTCDWPRNVQC